MATLSENFQAAIPYMPVSRQRSARSSALTLDTLLDEGRANEALLPGSLDLVLMGYRLHHGYQAAWLEFRNGTSGKVKPPELSDLLAMIYGALLTRDSTPAHALVKEGVDFARKRFGDHVSGLANAFLRRIADRRDEIRETLKKDPTILLGRELTARLSPALAAQAGARLLARPPAGIPSFDASADFRRRPIEDFSNPQNALQAMDQGSWELCRFLAGESFSTSKSFKFLDACAAPGGKTIALSMLARNASVKIDSWATDVDFKRLSRLRSNLTRWNLSESIQSSLADWATGEVDETLPKQFDFILADLPCTGSGTLHSRPDLLLEDLTARLATLQPLQAAIVRHLRARLAPGGRLAVSVCSVDPQEILAISETLGVKPVFESWGMANLEAAEGLTAWIVSS